MVFRFYRVKMGVPPGDSKHRKKNSAGFIDSLKQREKCKARNVFYPAFFHRPGGQETRNPRKKQKKLHSGSPFPAKGRRLPPYICPGRRPERARTAGSKNNPQKPTHMEFLNRIELRGIVGQSSLNRIGDAEVCRFSLVTEYSYKDRDNNPVVDTTWFNITAWEGKNMPDLRQIAKGVIVQVAGRVRTFRYTMADGAERSGWEILARRVTILPPDDDPVQPQRYL